MSQTVIRGTQILNNTVQRQDLDTSTVGQAVVTKLVQGSGITLSSTGADSGTGDVTVSEVASVSTDAGNIATLGSDSKILVPQSTLWSTRLRSFNAHGNPTFEIDQRNIGTALTNPANGTFIQDRHAIFKSAGLTGTVNTALQSVPTAPIVIPGTNFGITQNYQRFTVGTAQASLAAGDFWGFTQSVEGPRWRELSMDVHSVSLLVRSSVAGLTFSYRLRDSGVHNSLVKLCTISSANTWTLATLPNLPVWTGTYSAAAGQIAYLVDIFLACGSTYTAAASAAWQTGDIRGVTGMSNFLATAAATFDIAFILHQPGAVCETPIDCPFTQNYDDCLRYYCKSYDYATKAGTVAQNGDVRFLVPAGNHPITYIPYKRTMAKVPTIQVYSPVTGTPAAIRDAVANGDKAPTSYVDIGDSAFSGAIISSPNSSPWQAQFHFTADTGW